MSNELQFIFRREEIEKLVESKTDLIVIKAHLEDATLQDGSKAGVLKVRAEAINKGNPEPQSRVDGCPIPPCGIEG